MGNEKSQPAGLVIDENACEVTDRWALHSATYSGASGNPKISVFNGLASSSQTSQNLLEKFAKNLMVHRHPCILKYVTTWQKGGKFYLATEGVKPLVQVLPSQTALQVCIGLQNILKALIFLHDKAQSSHNNVCRAAVYVTQDGTWKLGGLEYLCRFSELSSGYLNSTRIGRYDAGISPCETDRMPQPPSSVDCFAFGVLAEEVLSAYNPDDVPGMQEFKDICKNKLQDTLSCSRPPLNFLLMITFFTHEFITIHNFLTELTLKSDVEKQEFFRGLAHKLSMFDEEVVASQLSTLLLSRMVLLDTTAQQHLLPNVFVPKTSNGDDVGSSRLFSEKTFKTYLVPKLLPMFCVRDAHVRLILLTHFSSFCSMFSSTHLKMHILPELLVGIKDTNDTLVSCTLRALADIVPILGSSVVIGGKSRKKLFADGRPKAASAKTSSKNHGARNARTIKHVEGEPGASEFNLPERASPDGGEDFNSPTCTASEEETENWTDWENNPEDMFQSEKDTTDYKNMNNLNSQESEKPKECIIDNEEIEQDPSSVLKESNMNDDKKQLISNGIESLMKINNDFCTNPKTSLPDITSLDIKICKSNVSNKSKSDPLKSTNDTNVGNDTSNVYKEVDYFQDMEPVIITSNKHNINDILPSSSSSLLVNKIVNKFEINDQDLMMNEVKGWGDDDDDTWAVDSDNDVNTNSASDTSLKNNT